MADKNMTSDTLIYDFKYGLFSTFAEWCELLGEKTVLAKIARLDFCVASEELIKAAKASPDYIDDDMPLREIVESEGLSF